MVCEFFEVPYDKLLQKTRKREIVQARQITMYLAKAFTKNSLKTMQSESAKINPVIPTWISDGLY